jgi:guanylate kinase
VDGKDYHFVEKEDMIKEVEDGKFIESATFSGNMYGKVTLLLMKCQVD